MATSSTVLRNLNNPEEIEKRLEAIVESFNSVELCEVEYLRGFPEWREKRCASIAGLDELANSLETLNTCCNVSKLAGDTIGLIGGLVGFAGVMHDLCNSGSSSDTSKKMIDRGKKAAILGTSLSAGTAFFEDFIQQQMAKKATSVLEYDLQETLTFAGNMQPVIEFIKTVEKIAEFDVFHNFIEGLRYCNNLPEKGNASYKIIGGHLPKIMQEVVDSLPIEKGGKDNLINLMSVIYSSVDCWQWFNILIQLNKKYPSSFQFARLLSKFSLQDLTFIKNPLSSLCSVLVKGATGISYSSSGAVAESIFSGARVAIDIVGLVATIKDMTEDTQSEIVRNIRKRSTLLQDELDKCQNVYDKLSFSLRSGRRTRYVRRALRN